MATQKPLLKFKAVKAEISKELTFIKDILTVLNIPLQSKGENEDLNCEITNKMKSVKTEISDRARNFEELEEKLKKLKTQGNLNLKNKLMKKSLNSKLNKKLKKKERFNKNKLKLQANATMSDHQMEKEEKPNVTQAKPVFNTNGKLVFSKFDFASAGVKGKVHRTQKDPKKLLDSLKEQDQKIRKLEESDDTKAKNLKEKIAWKNVLQKAEGVKVKDDPTLLKKSIKKVEQKKKQSKKQWDSRIQSVEQKKNEKQKKRKENISKKKKEKKSKVIKASVKKGRVVI